MVKRNLNWALDPRRPKRTSSMNAPKNEVSNQSSDKEA